MRTLYTVLLTALLPFVLSRLLWRSIKLPAYRHRWHERLGLYVKAQPNSCIWFHAVSVGETEAVFPLIKLFQSRHPTMPVLITTTTPTGSARVQSVLGNSVLHVYLPYDTPPAVQAFLKHFNPQMAVVVETEIWPNLFVACGKRGIPLFIINARLSEKSARGYQKLSALIKPALQPITLIAAQSEVDAERYQQIGMPLARIQNTGNIKFDLDNSPALKMQGQQLKATAFVNRFVWLCASTHADEELILLKTYQTLKLSIANLLLVLVPRHPERFGEVEKLIQLQGLSVVLRTEGLTCTAETDVYLADTLGELKMLYASSDVAFVGGSLVPKGGHNLLEASAVGVPVLFGPYMENFKDISKSVLNANAAIQCQDSAEIANAVFNLYADAEQRQILADNGRAFLQSNRGATERIYQILDSGLNKNQIH